MQRISQRTVLLSYASRLRLDAQRELQQLRNNIQHCLCLLVSYINGYIPQFVFVFTLGGWACRGSCVDIYRRPCTDVIMDNSYG